MGIFKKIKRTIFPQYRTQPVVSDTKLLNEIIAENRQNLAEIKTWIDEAAMKNSCFKYGMPDTIRPFIDVPLSKKPSYSDYINYYSALIKEPINYLEVGVSVGKNFFQVLNHVQNAQLTGFEIEEINPPLKQQLHFHGVEYWKNKADSIKKNDASFSTFSYATNKVNYLSADVFDENSWAKLAGQKFNIIFSDAFHDDTALFLEYEMIQKYDLLADKFLFFWDDLHGSMESAFVKITADMKGKYKLTNDNCFIFETTGWIGENEPPHPTGLITNIALK